MPLTVVSALAPSPISCRVPFGKVHQVSTRLVAHSRGHGPWSTRLSCRLRPALADDRPPMTSKTTSPSVSKIGRWRRTRFYPSVVEGYWSFGMKSADGPGGNVRARQPPGTPDPAAWVHLTGVYDDRKGEIRLYVAGELAAQEPFDAQWRAAGPLTIGGSQSDGAPSDFWPGAIGDVRIYPAALDGDNVMMARDVGKPTTSPPPACSGSGRFSLSSGRGRCLGPLWGNVLEDDGSRGSRRKVGQPPQFLPSLEMVSNRAG